MKKLFLITLLLASTNISADCFGRALGTGIAVGAGVAIGSTIVDAITSPCRRPCPTPVIVHHCEPCIEEHHARRMYRNRTARQIAREERELELELLKEENRRKELELKILQEKRLAKQDK